jgi:hypothetical protein
MYYGHLAQARLRRWPQWSALAGVWFLNSGLAMPAFRTRSHTSACVILVTPWSYLNVTGLPGFLYLQGCQFVHRCRVWGGGKEYCGVIVFCNGGGLQHLW